MVGRNTMIVRGSLPVRNSVGGDSSSTPGDRECRGVGRRLAQVRRGGRDKGLATARVVDTL